MAFSKEQDHRCPCCDIKCHRKLKLELHISNHTGEKPFLCCQCESRFSLKSNLQAHFRTVHQGIKRVYKKKYKCSLCSYKTISKHTLEDHIHRHIGERSFPCKHPNCDYVAKSSNDIRLHNTNKHTTVRKFSCPFPNCDYRGKTALIMRRHTGIHSEYRPFVCNVDGCSYRGKRSDTLKIHQRQVHHGGYKPFACSKCDHRTTSKSMLVVHQRTHTDVKSFKCTFSGCSFSFKSNGSLRRHVGNRHNEKTLKCDFKGCAATAGSQKILEEHKRQKHYEKVHKCPSCDYRAVYPWVLQKHFATHNDRKRFPCSTTGCTFRAKNRQSLEFHMRNHKGKLGCQLEGCGYVSKSSLGLKRHMKTHNPARRPFQCPICPRRFTKSGDVTRHLHRHTNEKPIKCPLCDFGATCKGSITRHVRAIHSRVFPQFVFDRESICDHCHVNFGCAVGLAIHRMKLKTAVVILRRLQLVQ